MVRKYGQGWFGESRRHSLARQGVKTGRNINYMYSLETIRQMSRERAEEAKAQGKQPLTYTGIPEDLKSIPNIGDHIPKGWKLVETHFVDSSGFGRPGEGALTFNEFAEKAKKGKGYAIIEEGQFQVRIGEFEKEINQSKNITVFKKRREEMRKQLKIAGPISAFAIGMDTGKKIESDLYKMSRKQLEHQKRLVKSIEDKQQVQLIIDEKYKG